MSPLGGLEFVSLALLVCLENFAVLDGVSLALAVSASKVGAGRAVRARALALVTSEGVLGAEVARV